MIALFVHNPRQVTDFAKVTGRRAKTDNLDAFVLTCLRQAIRPTSRTSPDAEATEFKEILARRRHAVRIMTAEKNRLGVSISIALRGGIEAHIRWLEKELSQADHDLEII